MARAKNGGEKNRNPTRRKAFWYEQIYAQNAEAMLILTLDADQTPNRIIEANEEACHIYGYSRDQLQAMTHHQLCWHSPVPIAPWCGQTPDSTPPARKRITRLFHVTSMGRRIHVNLTARPLEHAGGRYCLAVVRDITDEDTARELHHLLALLDNKVLHGTSFEALLSDVARVLRAMFDGVIVDIVTVDFDNTPHLQARIARTADIATALTVIEKTQRPDMLSLGTMAFAGDIPQKVRLRDTPDSYSLKTFFTSIACSELYGFPIMHGDTVGGMIKMAFDRSDAMTDAAVAQIQNLTQRLSVLFDHQVEQQQLRLRDMALSMVGNAIFITDVHGSIVWANEAMAHISGYTAQELLGHNPRIFQSGIHSREFYRNLWGTIRRRQTFRGRITNRKKDGTLYTIETVITPIVGTTGHITHFVSVRQDVTEQVMSEEVMHRLAKTDPLTGLLNRSALQERVRTALLRSRSDDTLCALIFLDIDDFKAVNDTFGHAVGDLILKEIGARLSKDIRASDCVGRIGGDEFVILLTGIPTKTVIGPWADHLMKQLSVPIVTENVTLSVTGSVGIALAPDHAADLDGLLQRADIAMYRAKRAGANCWRFYDPD